VSEDAAALKKRIKTLIVSRVIFVTLFFGSSFFFWGFERFHDIRSISYLIVALYGSSLVYYLLLRGVGNLVIFAYAQLVFDAFFEILLVYFTGGIDSWFSFTFVLTILASSIVLGKKAGFILATVSSILYGALVNLQLYGFLPVKSGGIMEAGDYLYKIFIYTIFFYLAAYLSGNLSSRLAKTVQKLEEKDLDIRDLEFFNREVIESLPSGLLTMDMSGNVLIFNRAAEKITGAKRNSVIGRKIDFVLPFLSFPFSEGRREETMVVDGSRKIIGLTMSALKGAAEKTKGFIVVFQDLTQIQRLEEEIKQKEKWAAIGELSSNIAHEIRNPLASLKGSVEMLREDSMPKNHKERLMEIALNEMDRLNRIITDFLTYSRPAPPEFKEFDLHALLDETIELLNNTDQNRGLVSVQKEYSGAAKMTGDPQKLSQVFWNLGLNAMDAMSEGGQLIISTGNSSGSVEITFRDSGTGIDAKNIEKIFFPFFTTKEQGTGLGLAISYRIVDEHKGKIYVESSPGKGTTFKVILPSNNAKS
jgi:two-component system sensor histidine kinase PilS (NtrC family)